MWCNPSENAWWVDTKTEILAVSNSVVLDYIKLDNAEWEEMACLSGQKIR